MSHAVSHPSPRPAWPSFPGQPTPRSPAAARGPAAPRAPARPSPSSRTPLRPALGRRTHAAHPAPCPASGLARRVLRPMVSALARALCHVPLLHGDNRQTDPFGAHDVHAHRAANSQPPSLPPPRPSPHFLPTRAQHHQRPPRRFPRPLRGRAVMRASGRR
jgi:hypothetical protein